MIMFTIIIIQLEKDINLYFLSSHSSNVESYLCSKNDCSESISKTKFKIVEGNQTYFFKFYVYEHLLKHRFEEYH